MVERDELEQELARALYSALVRASPQALIAGTAKDAAEWRDVSFDGRFKLRLVAKHLLASGSLESALRSAAEIKITQKS